ncbi:MAG: DUF1015 family protein [Acidimicrobiales bacterium]
MPLFAPFRGLRYDPATIGLAQVIAPPYDVIEPPERNRLSTRSALNSVHLELPEADLRSGLDRYQVAARLLRAWRSDGTLVLDEHPRFYLYEMTVPSGHSTLGVIGGLGLPEEDEVTDVLPHEETLPKARSDRLDLLSSTKANLSPIWGLSLTSGLSALLEPSGDAESDVHDDDGVRHRLWLASEDRQAAIAEAVGSTPVVIADGHHRYETARNYRRLLREVEGSAPGGHDLVMALVVELAEDQLRVGAIHRVLSGIASTEELVRSLSERLDVLHAGDGSDRVVGALAQASSLALVTRDDSWLLTVRPETYEAAGSELDSSVVELALADTTVTAQHSHSWQEAIAAVREGRAQAALLLRPPTVAQIAQWAHARRRMPPKTTYFSPKPRTGLVFRSLED